MFPKSRFSKRNFGDSAGSTKLDRPPVQTVLIGVRKFDDPRVPIRGSRAPILKQHLVRCSASRQKHGFSESKKPLRVVIFISLTEAPLPDPSPTPPRPHPTPRKGPETDPKRSQTEPNGAETEPNGAEMDRNQVFRGGTGRGFVGVGGVGACKGKRSHYLRVCIFGMPCEGLRLANIEPFARSSPIEEMEAVLAALDKQGETLSVPLERDWRYYPLTKK